MSRKPIQVPDETKTRLDGFQEKFRTKTTYEVIERLMNYYEQSERQKVEYQERANQLERKRKATMIYIGEELKPGYAELSLELGFGSNESSTLAFLMNHYEQSPTLSKETFAYYRGLL